MIDSQININIMSGLTHDKRVKIFAKWQLPNIELADLRQQPSIKKSSQCLRAEEVIRQSLILICNIEQFLSKKEDYEKEMDLKKIEISKNLDMLFELTNSNNQSQEAENKLQSNINKCLCEIYTQIRLLKSYQKQVETYFQGVNLANYDKKNVKIEFTRTHKQTNSDLLKRIKIIKEKIGKLQQALLAWEQKINLSMIFGKEADFEFCYDSLNEQLTHQNMIQIHYLMLYELDDLERMMVDINERNRLNEIQFNKYQAIYDCLCLMKYQTNQMKAHQKEFNSFLNLPRIEDSQGYLDLEEQFVLKNNQRNMLIQNHTKIYKSNLDNFIRVNAQTNMFLYVKRRSEFTQQLNQFETSFANWKDSKERINFFLEKYMQFEEVKNQIQLQRGEAISEKKKKRLLVIYHEVLQSQVKDAKEQVRIYKKDLLIEMEKYFQLKSLTIPKRIYEPESMEDFCLKLNQFFKNVKSKPNPQKISMLQDNLRSIQTLDFEVNFHKKTNPKSELLNIYSCSIRYCNIMAQKTPIDTKLHQIKEIFKDSGVYQLFPDGFSDLLFNYVNDLYILVENKGKNEKLRKSIKQNFESQIINKYSKDNHLLYTDKTIEKQFHNVQINLFELYNQVLCNISEFTTNAFSDEINDRLWIVGESIVQCYQQFPENQNWINIQINKKQFYSFRILSRLLILSKNIEHLPALRIKNIEEVMSYILQHLDDNYLYLTRQNKILELVKLRMLQEYFEKVFTRTHQLNFEAAIKMILKICTCDFLADAYCQLTKQNPNQQTYLSQLLSLHFIKQETYPNFKSEKNRQFLESQLKPLISQLKRQHLSLAIKHDPKPFIHLFKYQVILRQLADTLTTNMPNLVTIAKIYVLANKLKDMKLKTQIKYESYENIIVRENKNCCKFLERVRMERRGKLQKIGQDLNILDKIFLKVENRRLHDVVQVLIEKEK